MAPDRIEKQLSCRPVTSSGENPLLRYLRVSFHLCHPAGSSRFQNLMCKGSSSRLGTRQGHSRLCYGRLESGCYHPHSSRRLHCTPGIHSGGSLLERKQCTCREVTRLGKEDNLQKTQ